MDVQDGSSLILVPAEQNGSILTEHTSKLWFRGAWSQLWFRGAWSLAQDYVDIWGVNLGLELTV